MEHPNAAAEFISVLTSLLSAIGTVLGVLVAWWALDTWRDQIRGQATFETARKLVVAANKLALYFHAARSSFSTADEFPKSYNDKSPGERTPLDHANAWRHVFGARWNRVDRCYGRILALIPETRAFFSKEVFDAVDHLLRTARQLSFDMNKYARLLETADLAENMSEAALEARDKELTRVSDSVFSDTRDFDEPSENELSRRFMENHAALIRLLRPALHLK